MPLRLARRQPYFLYVLPAPHLAEIHVNMRLAAEVVQSIHLFLLCPFGAYAVPLKTVYEILPVILASAISLFCFFFIW
ncbi:hypothetical protein EV426DRAFT_601029 [Tirmania nivea]|nr:hypothetical protein EV426DRAFT_601029 [Tirmania nivea]